MTNEMKVECWPIDGLVLYARNPRKNDGAVDRECDTIRRFGFKIPSLVRGDDEVVDGHPRLKAARRRGMDQVPVILCDEWTPLSRKTVLKIDRKTTIGQFEEQHRNEQG